MGDMQKESSNLILECKHRNLIPDTLLSLQMIVEHDNG